MLCFIDRCCGYIASILCPIPVVLLSPSNNNPQPLYFRRASDSMQHLLRASVTQEMDEYMQWIADTFPHSTLRDGRRYLEIVEAFWKRFPRTSQEHATLVELFVTISEFRYANTATLTFLEDMARLMEEEDEDNGEMHEFIQKLVKEQSDMRVDDERNYADVLNAFLGNVQHGSGLYKRAVFKFHSMTNVHEFVAEIAWLMGLQTSSSHHRMSI